MQQDWSQLVTYHNDGYLIWKPRANNPSWSKRYAGTVAGTDILKNNRSNTKYRNINYQKKRYGVHRIIWFMHHGTWPEEIDHIDRNGLNNKIENLRNGTHQDNMKNLDMTKIHGIRHNGYSYTVRIQNNKKGIHLGSTKDFFDACCLRKSAENKYGFKTS